MDLNEQLPYVHQAAAKYWDQSLSEIDDASWLRLGYSPGFMLVILFIEVVIFNRVEKTFIDAV